MPQKKEISNYLQEHTRLFRLLLEWLNEKKKDGKCFTAAKFYPLYNTDEVFFPLSYYMNLPSISTNFSWQSETVITTSTPGHLELLPH